MVISSTQNVGIGMTAPAAKLTLNQSGGTDVDGIRIIDGGTTWNIYDVGGVLNFESTAGADFKMRDDGNFQVGGYVAPDTDNTYTSGTASLRWSAVWSVNGTIQHPICA